MKTDAEINEILKDVWQVFRRKSEPSFERERQVCTDHFLIPPERKPRASFLRTSAEIEEALQHQAHSDAEKSVARIFDQTIRPLFSDLEQIGRSKSDPVEWARVQTKKMLGGAVLTWVGLISTYVLPTAVCSLFLVSVSAIEIFRQL
jgi:hypothetical protein